jgi:selenocysteine lyase/cysteine desulfurase
VNAPRSAATRQAFPRLASDVYLDAAGGTPLGDFAAAGIRRYEEYWRLGPGDGRGEQVVDSMREVRERLAALVGAHTSEIALVHCTKAGEQIVIDGLPALRDGGNIVTNDLHFSGSLHNLEGLRRSGMDVRVVRATDWEVPADAMVDAMDARTALVSVSLVSNVNGSIAPVRELVDAAHRRGAFVYTDVIQAAGIVPFDVHDLGVDFAAGNGYKWLYGPYGAGFLYVRKDLQGTALPDRLFPGRVRRNYAPWSLSARHGEAALGIDTPEDARRYEPGHVGYLGYCALNEGLRFLQSIGVPALLEHTTRLIRRLRSRLDLDRYTDISTCPDGSPIATFLCPDPRRLDEPLRLASVVVGRAEGQIRVSPAIYNTDSDIDLLADVLNDVDF